MECSRAVESLDSLWFFSNILSGARSSFSAAEAEETEEKEEEEPVKNRGNEPEDKAAQAKPVAQTSEQDSLPKCPRRGNLEKKVAEIEVMTSPAVEAAGTPESAQEESKLQERTRRSERRQRSKRMLYKRRRRVLGELDLGRDGKDYSGFEENRFLRNHCRGFGVASEIQAMKKMPPLSDGIAMREHIRSWAIAVACAVN